MQYGRKQLIIIKVNNFVILSQHYHFLDTRGKSFMLFVLLRRGWLYVAHHSSSCDPV